MRKKFRDMLHAYRVQSFKVSHGGSDGSLDDVRKAIVQCTEEALNNAYEYHFHTDPEPRSVEIFNMIKSYTTEALLPPVVERIMRRVTALEKQHEALVSLIDDILEELSDEEDESARDAV